MEFVTTKVKCPEVRFLGAVPTEVKEEKEEAEAAKQLLSRSVSSYFEKLDTP